MVVVVSSIGCNGSKVLDLIGLRSMSGEESSISDGFERTYLAPSSSRSILIGRSDA